MLNIGQFQKLLTRAGHPGTSDFEALLAARKAYQMIDEQGLGFDHITIQEPVSATPFDGRVTAAQHFRALDNFRERLEEEQAKSSKLRREKKALKASLAEAQQMGKAQEAALAEARAKIAALEAKNAALEASNNALEEKNVELQGEARQLRENALSDTGAKYISWMKFNAAAATKAGREKGWKAAVASELDIDLRLLNAWQTVGVIPAEYLDRVRALSKEQIKPASRQKWTNNEEDVLTELVKQGMSDRAIAKTLSAQFGRRLLESSITGARRRFRISKVTRAGI